MKVPENKDLHTNKNINVQSIVKLKKNMYTMFFVQCQSYSMASSSSVSSETLTLDDPDSRSSRCAKVSLAIFNNFIKHLFVLYFLFHVVSHVSMLGGSYHLGYINLLSAETCKTNNWNYYTGKYTYRYSQVSIHSDKTFTIVIRRLTRICMFSLFLVIFFCMILFKTIRDTSHCGQ